MVVIIKRYLSPLIASWLWLHSLRSLNLELLISQRAAIQWFLELTVRKAIQCQSISKPNRWTSKPYSRGSQWYVSSIQVTNSSTRRRGVPLWSLNNLIVYFLTVKTQRLLQGWWTLQRLIFITVRLRLTETMLELSFKVNSGMPSQRCSKLNRTVQHRNRNLLIQGKVLITDKLEMAKCNREQVMFLNPTKIIRRWGSITY